VSQSVVLASDRWRLVFESQAGRWRSRAELRRGEQWVALLESIEGEDSDPWPPSPPWQETHLDQHAAAGPVLMLLGRAGTSHWSASVELAGSFAVFDCACRVKAAPQRLGQRYRLLFDAEVRSRDGELAIDGEPLALGERLLVRPVAPPGEQQPAEIEYLPAVREISIVVAGSSETGPKPSWPATLRWGFALGVDARAP